MIISMPFGENSFEKLSDKEFIKEHDEFMKLNPPLPINFPAEARWLLCFLMEYNRRFRPNL